MSCLTLRIAQSPVDKYVKLNENKMFECHVEDYQEQVDIVEWCKNDFCTWGRAIEMNDGRLRFKSLPKYFIAGDRKKGEWNLLIENVTHSDIGQYKCTVTRRTNEFIFKAESTTANLTIMGLAFGFWAFFVLSFVVLNFWKYFKEKPAILKLEKSRLGDGEFVLNQVEDVYCRVKNGKPTSIIYWSLVDGEISHQTRTADYLSRFKLTDQRNDRNVILRIINSTQHESTTFDYWLKLNATISLLNKTLACVVEHPLFSEPLVTAMRINLKC
jgi:hypothetical protein